MVQNGLKLIYLKEANDETQRNGMGVGVEWGIVGGDIDVVGGVCGAAEWEIPIRSKSLPLLPRDRGAAAVDAGGGVVERAEVSEWHVGEYL